jgi:aminoglycoside phosphotransferase (APT) family kinase protein
MATLASAFSTLQQSRPPVAAAAVAGAVAAGGAPTSLAEALRAMDLGAAGETARETLLRERRGARVSRVELGSGVVCVKRTAASREAPVAPGPRLRLAAEARWLRAARAIVPGCAPAVLGEHPSGCAFAMEDLPAREFPSWQSRLTAGEVEPWIGAEVGHVLGRIHAATAHSAAVRQQFEGSNAFLDGRLAEVFERGAAANPDCAWELRRREGALATARVALVHGDLVPANILVGPRGVMLVDADCAHFGDPMADAASLLAELMVRQAAHTQRRGGYVACCEAFLRGYMAHIDWEMPEHAEARIAALIPAYVLGAILAGGGAAALVPERARAVLRAMVLAPPERLELVCAAWLEAVGAD